MLSDAPGCIGSPILRLEGHALCKRCPFRTVCGKLATRNADRLARELGIEKIDPERTGKMLMPGATKMTIAELESPRFKDKRPLTSRGADLVRRLEREGYTTAALLEIFTEPSRAAMRHALNRIDMDWVQELLVLIWDNGGRVKRSVLSEFLQHDCGFAKLSAQTHASTFVNALTNMDVLKEEGQNIKVLKT